MKEKKMSHIDNLLEERGSQWGDAVATHTQIAMCWSGLFDRLVNPVDVALAMIQLKTIRAKVNPYNRDSFDDIMGYCQIAMQIAGHDVEPEETGQDPLQFEEYADNVIQLFQDSNA